MEREAKGDVRGATAANAQGPANPAGPHFTPPRAFMARLGRPPRIPHPPRFAAYRGPVTHNALPTQRHGGQCAAVQFSGERAMAHLPTIARRTPSSVPPLRPVCGITS